MILQHDKQNRQKFLELMLLESKIRSAIKVIPGKDILSFSYRNYERKSIGIIRLVDQILSDYEDNSRLIIQVIGYHCYDNCVTYSKTYHS